MHSPSALSLRRYSASPGSHSHDHFQVLLGLSGTLELEIAGRGLRLHPGHGCVIAPEARHDFQSTGGSLCLVLDTRQAGWGERVHHLQDRPGVFALARYLGQAVEQGLPLAQLHGPSLLMEAWVSPAAAAHTQPKHSQPRSTARTIDWWGLQQWAMAQWHRPVAVADLAARVYLSPSQFAARCREDQGMSPMQWLRGLRLQQAHLLRHQGLPVAEVARRTGYRSPSALTAALRRQQG